MATLRSLPSMLVAILLPFELSLLFSFDRTSVFVLETLILVLLTPPVMAVFVAATVRSSAGGRDAYELTPFIATKPLTNTALIRAKLEATIRSTLLTWLLVLVAAPLALGLSGTSHVVVDAAHELVDFVGAPRAVVVGLLGLTAFMASTWKQLVQSLYIGMSGREWLVKASVLVNLTLLTLVVIVGAYVDRNSMVIATLWDNLPLFLAILVVCKVSVAAWIAVRLHDSRALGNRTLAYGALSWTVAVLALHGLLVWLLPILFRGYFLALVAILVVPLARLSAAPLALARNRHR